jgi:group I intron endonuclease
MLESCPALHLITFYRGHKMQNNHTLISPIAQILKDECAEYCVYKHTCPEGKSYIGRTKNYQKRCSEHQRMDKCSLFYEAIQKHGWGNFSHEILKSNITVDEANNWEKFYIEKENTMYPNGYNLTSGGTDTFDVSDLTKKKLSIAHTGKKLSEDHKRKLSLHRHSEDAKEKMRRSNKGISAETRAKMNTAMKGLKKSEAHRMAMSESRKGKPQTERRDLVLKRITEENKTPVYGIDKNGISTKIYESVNEAAKDIGIHPSNISRICRGKCRYRKTAGGYAWRYADGELMIERALHEGVLGVAK